MKHVIQFRGVGIPEIRKMQKTWTNEYLIDLSEEEQIEIAIECFRQEFCEDKLSGVLLFENYLYDKKPLNYMLEQYEKIFDEKLIFDWNICDWFCVRVLKKTIDMHGQEAALRISKWNNSNYLWKARASVVAFIGLTKDTKYLELILKNCKVLIQREERFSKTAVGWILHDIYKDHKKHFINFIDNNLGEFSIESLKNAIKYADKDVQLKYIDQYKAISKYIK